METLSLEEKRSLEEINRLERGFICCKEVYPNVAGLNGLRGETPKPVKGLVG